MFKTGPFTDLKNRLFEEFRRYTVDKDWNNTV